MEGTRADTGREEGLEGVALSHEERMIQITFSKKESEKLESDVKHATDGNTPTKKRKRSPVNCNLDGYAMEFFGVECQKELTKLYEVYEEVSSYDAQLEEGQFYSLNNAVACLLEERNLSFSKIVEEIHGKLKDWEGYSGIAMASVRSAVLFVGQRTLYGIMKEDVDVLEDESRDCLWCWETRDIKLLPKSKRGFFKTRRASRKKIHERISALKNIITTMSMPQSTKSYKSDLMKASQRLGKTLNVSEIRSLAGNLMQKSSTEMTEKEAKLREKELTKSIEKNKRSAEKEKKRIDREIQKEKLQAEKELKRIQEESAKDEKRREKEEAELSKHIKKQEEQAKRDQCRQAKEAAELKKQLTIKKQAKIMERFFNCNKEKSPNLSTCEEPKPEEPCFSKGSIDTITLFMDEVLSQRESSSIFDLRRMHIVGWQKARSSSRLNRWGVRQKPRVSLIQVLKLQGSSSEPEPSSRVSVPDKDSANGKLICSTESSFIINPNENTVAASNCSARCGIVDDLQSYYLSKRKLLQFDKSNRPAYYGTWNRKSGFVGPRHPFQKDPELDYDFESDEEWEEEEPGESLSDCEKDKEDELLDNENLRDEDDDNESEDSFLVPDGYLSENEGVQFDGVEDNVEIDSGFSAIDNENEEFKAFFQKQKYLNTLTEQALRKSQPLIITNLMHEKSAFINAEDLSGTAKLEQICLQLLCMRVLPGGSAIDISIDQPSNNDQTACILQGNDANTSSAAAPVVPLSDLPEFIRAIQSSPNSINKVVGTLQQKFSNISKTKIKNTIKDISDFVDNRWQVKKEVLDKFAPSMSPVNCSKRPKGIAMFFSKRCLPPVEETKIEEPSSRICGNKNVNNSEYSYKN